MLGKQPSNPNHRKQPNEGHKPLPERNRPDFSRQNSSKAMHRSRDYPLENPTHKKGSDPSLFVGNVEAGAVGGDSGFHVVFGHAEVG